MAVDYQSVKTTPGQNRDAGEGTTVDRPTSLAEDELMIAIIEITDDSGACPTPTSPSGWTNIKNYTYAQGGNSVRVWVDAKKATAADVAATNFTWTGTGQSGGTTSGGKIYRVTGQGDISSIQCEALGNTSASWACGLTPSFANSLLIAAIVASGSSASGSVSGIAIATDDPTFTERYDEFTNNATADSLVAGATANRSQVTATGNLSATFTTFPAGCSVGVLICIPPVTNATASPAVVEVTVSAQDASAVTGTAVASPAVVQITATPLDPTVTTPANPISNEDKSTASWDNEDKSTLV